MGGLGIGKISQQGKLRVGFAVGQKVQFELAHQTGQGGRVGQQGRNHHQHPVLRRYAIGQRQAGQVLRLHGLADQAMQHRNHGFTGRPERQKCQQPQRRPGCAGQSVVRHKPTGQPEAAQRQHTQISRCHEALQAHAPRLQTLGHAQHLQQGHQPRSVQPVPRRLAGLVQQHRAACSRLWRRRIHQLQYRARDRQLGQPGAPPQPLDRVQADVLGVIAFRTKNCTVLQLAYQQTAARDQAAPVGIAQKSQRGDGIAHAQAVGGLRCVLLNLRRGGVRQYLGEQLVQFLQRGRRDAPRLGALRGQIGAQALQHLQGKNLPDAAPGHVVQQQRQPGLRLAADFQGIAPVIGMGIGGSGGRHALGQAAQVLDQHHAQGGGQSPQLAQRQLARVLVGAQKIAQQIFIKGAVGVRHKSPGHPVNARQTGQMGLHQHRQIPKIAPWQPVMDLLDLRHHHIKIVQQPFTCSADVVAGGIALGDSVIGLAQDADVVAQARKKRRHARMHTRMVCLRQTGTMLGKTRTAKNLRAYRRLYGTPRRVQQRCKTPIDRRSAP